MTEPGLLFAWRRRFGMTRLLEPIDVSWLAALRILLGVLLAVSMARFIAYGWVDKFFVAPTFHFKYWGLGFVEALPGGQMQALFWSLVGLSLCVAAGLAFRVSAVALALGLTYVQLIDVSTYLNHYYLAALLVWLLSASPAHRKWSLDAWLWRRRRAPERESAARAWLYLFRVQVGLVYFFAGLAKAQSDWLVHAQPLSIWLGASTDLPLLGPLFTLPGVPHVLSWAGFLFDTTIVLWLLLRRTRPWALLLVVVFHAVTRLLFPIGMFPFIMVTAALVFLEPNWPRVLGARLSAVARKRGGRHEIHSRLAPSLASPTRAALASGSRRRWGRAHIAVALGAMYCLIQFCLPLRGYLYPGNVLWHEQGMRFSWRVMVRAKGGNTTFIVRNTASGATHYVSPRRYLTAMQEMEMSSQPDLIVQLAHHIQRDMEHRGLGPVEVRADARVALNGRRSARFIDPDQDLTRVADGLGVRHWVLAAPEAHPARTRPVL